MTEREALKLALEVFGGNDWHDEIVDSAWADKANKAITAIKEVLAQPEQEFVKIAHKHEWFRTGEMKVGQMRCIGCGKWGQEEAPQREWVGLTDEDILRELERVDSHTKRLPAGLKIFAHYLEARLKEKNT